MKTQIALLIDLQKIDQEIRTLNTKKQTLPEKARELDQDFQARKDKVEEERKGLEGLNKLHKEKESELKQGQEKLRKAKERLLEVKTNKEYQAMLTEIDTIEKSSGRIEEEILVLYDRIDEKKGASRATKRISSSIGTATKRNGKRSTRSLPPSMGNWEDKRKNSTPSSRA